MGEPARIVAIHPHMLPHLGRLGKQRETLVSGVSLSGRLGALMGCPRVANM